MIGRIPPLAAATLLALIAFNAWLLTIVLDRGDTDGPLITGALGPAPTVRGLTQLPPEIRPITSYNQTLAQPLFFKSRTPFVAPPPRPLPSSVPPQPANSDPGLTLGGIIVSGSIKKAYLFAKNSPEGAWVSEGEAFMGWTVRSVHNTSTTLHQRSQKVELHLYPPQ